MGIQVLDDEYYMRKAIELAKKAASIGEVPVGAVIVNKKDGKIVGSGYNMREKLLSPLAHAEIIAIKEASKNLGGWRIVDSVMYITLEPCSMCAGAITNAHIDKVIFGAYDEKNGAAGSITNILNLHGAWKPEVFGGLLKEECSLMIKNFFKDLRTKKKKIFI